MSKEQEKLTKCLVCKKDILLIDNANEYTFSPPLDESFISKFIGESQQVIKNKDGSIDCEVHQDCEKELKKEQLIKARTELRKMKCNICQTLLLGEKNLYTSFYSIFKTDFGKEGKSE